MIDKKTQGRRRLGLVAAVVVLVLAIVLVVRWGCGDGGIGGLGIRLGAAARRPPT